MIGLNLSGWQFTHDWIDVTLQLGKPAFAPAIGHMQAVGPVVIQRQRFERDGLCFIRQPLVFLPLLFCLALIQWVTALHDQRPRLRGCQSCCFKLYGGKWSQAHVTSFAAELITQQPGLATGSADYKVKPVAVQIPAWLAQMLDLLGVQSAHAISSSTDPTPHAAPHIFAGSGRYGWDAVDKIIPGKPRNH
ncbi:hypothetical protein D3C85_1310920 [compost metagenome]